MDLDEFIPGLPQDVALQCLIRVSHDNHSEMRHVCRGWRSLVGSGDFYAARHRSEQTAPSICLVQAAAPKISDAATPGSAKQGTVPRFTLNLYDFQLRSWQRLPPIPDFDGIPLFCQIVGAAGKIFVIGGWNPSSFEATRTVYWFDFSQKIWRRAADMTTARSFFAAGAVGGKIYVAGGHDENKNALRTSERLDIDRNIWEPMPDLGQERDECRGIIVDGRKFAVFSGYRTDSQGEFTSSSEILSESGDSWDAVEDFFSESGEGGVVCGGASGAVYRVRDNGEVWKMGSCGCSCSCSCGKIGAVPVAGKILAACSGSRRMGQEIVVLVEEAGGVCKGLGLRRPASGKDSWEILADGGEEDFRGVVQAACLVDI